MKSPSGTGRRPELLHPHFTKSDRGVKWLVRGQAAQSLVRTKIESGFADLLVFAQMIQGQEKWLLSGKTTWQAFDFSHPWTGWAKASICFNVSLGHPNERLLDWWGNSKAKNSRVSNVSFSSDDLFTLGKNLRLPWLGLSLYETGRYELFIKYTNLSVEVTHPWEWLPKALGMEGRNIVSDHATYAECENWEAETSWQQNTAPCHRTMENGDEERRREWTGLTYHATAQGGLGSH